MDAKKAIAAAASGNVTPVLVCFGTEKYRMETFIARLAETLIEPEHREFAISKYDLADTSLETVIADAETPPFMVPRKLIVARPAVFLTGQKDTSKVEHPVDRLQSYLQNPADFSCLVLAVEADKLDERKKIVKQLKAADALVPFPPMTANELHAWVLEEAKKRGVAFTRDAAETLIMYTGGHLQTMSAELEKLLVYSGGTVEIDRPVVAELVAPNMEQNVFLLIDEVVRLRLERALRMFHDLLKQKEEPIKIAMLMARQFRIMLQTKELGRQGYSQQQIAAQAGVHPYAVKVAAEQGRAYEVGALARILAELAELDYRMKTGRIDKVLGLELFLMKLVHEQQTPAQRLGQA